MDYKEFFFPFSSQMYMVTEANKLLVRTGAKQYILCLYFNTKQKCFNITCGVTP